MNIFDDVTLIRQFVISNPTPITSQNFRTEAALSVTQLLSQSGELLASLDRAGQVGHSILDTFASNLV